MDTDLSLLQLVISYRNSLLTSTMKDLSILGNQGLWVIGIALVVFLITQKRHREWLFFTVTAGSAPLVAGLLKSLFVRPRPQLSALVHETGYSFPSSHALSATVFFLALGNLLTRLYPRFGKNLWLRFIFFLLVLLIGFSRIYLGVHYPSDVLAGFLFGLTWFYLLLALNNLLHRPSRKI